MLEGEFTVWQGNTKLTLTQGQLTPKIRTNEIHYFKNLSQKNVLANIIIEPGHAGCEHVTRILGGLEKDGLLSSLNKFKGYNVLWIVLLDLTNTLPTGIPKVIFKVLRLFCGRKNRKTQAGTFG